MPEAAYREFNDGMAGEGQVSHIPTIIRLMYATILAYSVGCSFLTGDRWYVQVMFYFVFLVNFYFWHWLAHQKFMGKMYDIHWQHHFEWFPPSHFYGGPGVTNKRAFGSDCPTLWQLMDPRKSTNFTLAHEGILYALSIISLAVARFALHFSWATLGCAVLMAAVMGTVGSALHSSFHVRGFHLEHLQWYQELRALHYIHHLGSTQHNFGVLNLGLVDGLFHSLQLTDPLNKKDKEETSSTLPDNISPHMLQLVATSDGSLGRAMLLADITNNPSGTPQQLATQQRGMPTVLVRILIIAFAVWFWQEGCVRVMQLTGPVSHYSDVHCFDFGHHLTSPLYVFIREQQPHIFGLLHDGTILISNVILVGLIVLSVWGSTTRPALTVALTLVMRTLLQFFTPFVATSHEYVRHESNMPSLFSTTSNSVSYLCPHILPALTLLLETRWNPALKLKNYHLLFQVLMAVPLVFQMVAALVLRSNWTFDVLVMVTLTGLMAAMARRAAVCFDYVKSL
eukprot:GDKI01022147.1.p1 GENE.GDKI01022147.1~~GDKI01022147.1.p1  ORF type:complete len:510 (+),score=158.09 GDKI01022147.1:100-1629(+)